MKILAPLEGATRTLCGDTYPTSSMVIPTIRATINEIKKIRVESDDSLFFRAKLVENLVQRFKNAETNPVLSVATLLDPRFKTSGFSKPDFAETAKTAVYSAYNSMVAVEKSQNASSKRRSQPNSNVSTNDSDNSQVAEQENRNGKRRREEDQEKRVKKSRMDFADLLQNDVDSRDVPKQNRVKKTKTIEEQLDGFLELERIQVKDNVFKYWKSIESEFPDLCRVAMKHLIMQASSAPSRRIFHV